MEDTVYLNGEYLPLSKAHIPAADYGFLFGYGLYDTVRTYNGKFFRLERHMERLARSAELLQIPFDNGKIRQAFIETSSRNPHPFSRVRVTISPGPGAISADLSTCRAPTVLITATPYTPHPPEVYALGFKAVTSTIHRNSGSPLPGMKTVCFMESLLARRQARQAGADDALLLNDRGCLAESSSSTVFIVSGGILKTPCLGDGLLPGITRYTVLELAVRMGIPASETDILPQELESAEEAFLSNSMIEILALTSVDGKMIGPGKPGKLTLRLMQAYRELVASEAG